MTTDAAPPSATQTLVRPVDGRMAAGVAAAVARYLDVDVTLVRIVLLVLALVGGAGLPLYLAGWLLIPEQGCRQSLAADLVDQLRPGR